jgi:hypothetical protein
MDDIRGTELIAEVSDPVLDLMLGCNPASRASGLGPWKLVRVVDAFPSAWVARHVRRAHSWGNLYTELSRSDARDEVWFLPEDEPVGLQEPEASSAQVESWDGRKAVVKHDGSCTLVLQRTYYPGWMARVNDSPEQQVLKVNGGLQGIQLPGSGTSEVTVQYRPTGLKQAMSLSAVALGSALAILAIAGWRNYLRFKK